MAWAPVHEAAHRNDIEELGRLLDEDPGLIETEDPSTPLIHACLAGSVDAARLLLDRGALVNGCDRFGDTPFLAACYAGYMELVVMLRDRGAIFSLGHALITASGGSGVRRPGSDHIMLIRWLLKDGRVPVNARGEKGRTALWRACYYGYDDRAQVLLVEGLADHTIPDDKGLTPMAVAQREGDEDCIRLLQWYEGELRRVFLLSKARAVLDATHSITKAPERAKAMTQAEARRAREEAAPAWLRGRVCRGEALPVLEVVGQAGQHDAEAEEDKEEQKKKQQEEEQCAVSEWLVGGVSDDLYVEMMEGLRYRRWIPG